MGKVDDVPKFYWDTIKNKTVGDGCIRTHHSALEAGISKLIEPISEDTAVSIQSFLDLAGRGFIFKSVDLGSSVINELWCTNPNRYHNKTNYKPKYTL